MSKCKITKNQKNLKVRKTKNIWSNGKAWLPQGTCIVRIQGPGLSQDIYIYTPVVSVATRSHLGGKKKTPHFFRNAQSLKEIASSLYQKREMRSEKGENKSKYLYYRKSNAHLFQETEQCFQEARLKNTKLFNYGVTTGNSRPEIPLSP